MASPYFDEQILPTSARTSARTGYQPLAADPATSSAASSASSSGSFDPSGTTSAGAAAASQIANAIANSEYQKAILAERARQAQLERESQGSINSAKRDYESQKNSTSNQMKAGEQQLGALSLASNTAGQSASATSSALNDAVNQLAKAYLSHGR